MIKITFKEILDFETAPLFLKKKQSQKVYFLC